jgi:hypothetical protein
MYKEEALRLQTARSTRSSRREHGMGGDGCQMAWLDLALLPTPCLYRRPNELPSWRSISNPNLCLIWVQPELGFQPLKRATLWVHAHIDMARVLLLGH